METEGRSFECRMRESRMRGLMMRLAAAACVGGVLSFPVKALRAGHNSLDIPPLTAELRGAELVVVK